MFDPEKSSIRPVYQGPGTGSWIHSLADSRDRAYAILSGPGRPKGFDGILEIDLTTGQHQITGFDSGSTQVYGGVQTVDPTGRIWYYRAYPTQQMWIDVSGGMRPRRIKQYEDWNIVSWDSFRGVNYLIFSNHDGAVTKKPANLWSLELLDIDQSLPVVQQYLGLIPIDLYHNAGPSLKSLYFEPNTSSFFTRDERLEQFAFIGRVFLGKTRLMGLDGPPQETPVAWLHPTLGEIEVLGLESQDLILWLRGQKAYGRADLRSGSISVQQVQVQNLSAADITSLVAARDGYLYGSGYLTMSDLFRFNPINTEIELLPSAIPFGEGQINTMFNGLDGLIYGAGYPDSVLFKFDPALAWNPGSQPGSNPLNLGPMGHHSQNRAYRGVQTLDGSIWIQSTSDYSPTAVHALARADFTRRSMTVKTDIDDGIPQVDDLAVFDRQHLVLLGRDKNGQSLFLLNQDAFRVVKSRSLGQAGGTLSNLDPTDPLKRRLFLSQGNRLYRVTETLSLEPVHRSPGPILRLLEDGPTAVFLIGQSYIERLDLESGRSEVARPQHQKRGGRVFRDVHWKPAAAQTGSVFFGDGPELWRFKPTPSSLPVYVTAGAGCSLNKLDGEWTSPAIPILRIGLSDDKPVTQGYAVHHN